jgi:hypothetical protein
MIELLYSREEGGHKGIRSQARNTLLLNLKILTATAWAQACIYINYRPYNMLPSISQISEHFPLYMDLLKFCIGFLLEWACFIILYPFGNSLYGLK